MPCPRHAGLQSPPAQFRFCRVQYAQCKLLRTHTAARCCQLCHLANKDNCSVDVLLRRPLANRVRRAHWAADCAAAAVTKVTRGRGRSGGSNAVRRRLQVVLSEDGEGGVRRRGLSGYMVNIQRTKTYRSRASCGQTR